MCMCKSETQREGQERLLCRSFFVYINISVDKRRSKENIDCKQFQSMFTACAESLKDQNERGDFCPGKSM